MIKQETVRNIFLHIAHEIQHPMKTWLITMEPIGVNFACYVSPKIIHWLYSQIFIFTTFACEKEGISAKCLQLLMQEDLGSYRP